MQSMQGATSSASIQTSSLFEAPLKVRSFDEITQIMESIQNSSAQSLLVLDLDDTVIKPRTSLGTEADLRRRKLILQRSGKWDAEKKALFRMIDAFRNVVPYGPTEADLPRRLRNHQQKWDIIGLTARIPAVKEMTGRNLKEAGIHLNVVLFNEDKDVHKGIRLSNFLDNCPYERVVFVDDSIENIENVHKTLKGRVIALHYCPPEKPINTDFIEMQEKAFNEGRNVPTDEELNDTYSSEC